VNGRPLLRSPPASADRRGGDRRGRSCRPGSRSAATRSTGTPRRERRGAGKSSDGSGGIIASPVASPSAGRASTVRSPNGRSHPSTMRCARPRMRRPCSQRANPKHRRRALPLPFFAAATATAMRRGAALTQQTMNFLARRCSWLL
jgi:hypothetical protein